MINFIEKESLAHVFSCQFCEIFKNIFFTEHLWTTASKLMIEKLIMEDISYIFRYKKNWKHLLVVLWVFWKSCQISESLMCCYWSIEKSIIFLFRCFAVSVLSGFSVTVWFLDEAGNLQYPTEVSKRIRKLTWIFEVLLKLLHEV